MKPDFKYLFEPIEIGKVTLKNRIVSTAHGTSFANTDGTVSEKLIAYHAARARGGCGLIINEATSPDPGGKGRVLVYELGLWDDRFIPGFKALADAIHQHGAKYLVQLHHAGRLAISQITGVQPVAPSVQPSRWLSVQRKPYAFASETPRELSIDEIKELIGHFVMAAARAKEAGCDGVEVHGAHGYLVSQFLSPVVNQRNDEYGGSVEGRARFAVEAIREIRKRCGDDFVISIRINGNDYIEGGTTLNDAVAYAPLFEKAGVDLINVSGGYYGSMPATILPMAEPHGAFVHLATGVKSVVNVPVCTIGRITDPLMAEEILREGKADLVGMTRAQIADPELANKTKAGSLDDIRRCMGCNEHGEGEVEEAMETGRRDLLHEAMGIKCVVNPLVGREFETHLQPAEKPRKVVVIGGGPGGMKAAEVAAYRGHQVTLFEEKRLGGHLHLASMPPHGTEWQDFIQYLSRRLERLKVEIRQEYATPTSIGELAPDVVIVATGAVQDFPDVPGINSSNVLGIFDVFEQNKPVGKRVLIFGGQLIGCQTAEYLAEQGKVVTVLEPSNHFLTRMYDVTRFYLRTKLSQLEVEMIKNASISRIDGSEVTIGTNGKQVFSGIDTLVVDMFKPNYKLAQEIRAKMPQVELHLVGNAREITCLHTLGVTRDAFNVGDKI